MNPYLKRSAILVFPPALSLFFAGYTLAPHVLAAAQQTCTCGVGEEKKCYWEIVEDPCDPSLYRCVDSTGNTSGNCSYNPALADYLPSGEALAADKCIFSDIRAAAQSTAQRSVKIVHRDRCYRCSSSVKVTMAPSINTCAHAFDSSPNSAAYCWAGMAAHAIPEDDGEPKKMFAFAGGSRSGEEYAHTESNFEFGTEEIKVSFGTRTVQPYDKQLWSDTGTAEWEEDTCVAEILLTTQADVNAYADGHRLDAAGARSFIPGPKWNLKARATCHGGCDPKKADPTWSVGSPPKCPDSLRPADY